MRAGGCTLQQALTSEAATIVKQAVNLAKRRGHAQVTPLHVANTMLASSTGLLRTACLQSNSHPLQCKALELCFNVALNRLPSTTSNPLLGHNFHYPSLSNALIAAFKRAQAHQRRGSIENQQQPILAAKVEIEQLIISILDDPSVSRVMREAGFSSTQVKNNVEQSISLEICSQTPSKESNLLVLGSIVTQSSPCHGQFEEVRSEDVMTVLEAFMNKRKRNIVIVGEYLGTVESVIRGVMDKVNKGEVSMVLRDVQFISFPLFSSGNLSKEEVEVKLEELRFLVKSCIGRGAILYLGDLKWVFDLKTTTEEKGMNCYSPVEHMIMELGRLFTEIGENERLWLMGIATFHSYTRCKMGHPSLESVWNLHPLTIPAGSLDLSLNPNRDLQGQLNSSGSVNGSGWPLLEAGVKRLNCCADCSANFENEARSLTSNTSNHGSTTTSTTSCLPSWLQSYKEENNRMSINDQDYLPMQKLYKKWNSICSSVHKHHYPLEKTLNFSSISPSSSTSISSYDQHYPNFHKTLQCCQPKQSWREHHIWISDTIDEPFPEFMVPKPNQVSNPNLSSIPITASSSEEMEMEYLHRFKEISAENLKTLCNALEKKVPWQKDLIPEIASTILQCRSGMIRRREKLEHSETKEDTWLFFLGVDTEGKEKIAKELASLVFGSLANFLSIGLNYFTSTRADSSEDLGNKRMRDESSCSYLEKFAEGARINPHRVFLIEDVEQIDYCSQEGIKKAIETGIIISSNGEQVHLSDAIIILSCESFSARSRACSPPIKQKSKKAVGERNGGSETNISPWVSLDLNLSAEEDTSSLGLLPYVDRKVIFNLQDL